MSGERGEKVMRVSRPAITHALLRDGPAREINLPDDVELEELWHTPDGMGYKLRVSSVQWETLDEGEPREQINPEIREVEE